MTRISPDLIKLIREDDAREARRFLQDMLQPQMAERLYAHLLMRAKFAHLPEVPSTRSPLDCGSADAYYGRQPSPHKIDAQGNVVTDLTEDEIRMYHCGYNNEDDRKDWE